MYIIHYSTIDLQKDIIVVMSLYVRKLTSYTTYTLIFAPPMDLLFRVSLAFVFALTHLMAYINLIFPRQGSMLTGTFHAGDYHDGLVIGDAFTIIVVLLDIVFGVYYMAQLIV